MVNGINTNTLKHVRHFDVVLHMKICLCNSLGALGPLLFNIFLNDLFFLPLNSHLVNYADDNHICLENDNLDVLQKQLQDDSNIAVRWFNNNQTTANPDKFQSIILSRDRVDQFDISLDGLLFRVGIL